MDCKHPISDGYITQIQHKQQQETPAKVTVSILRLNALLSDQNGQEELI